ncbi:MAG: tetratricopeptide repeat protein [Oceanidesulfovibrio sp.]
MSTQLTQARQKISQVNTFLKQEKYIPAVAALHQAVRIVISQPLMRQEKEEFAELLGKAVYSLDAHQGFRQIIPLKLAYAPGNERELLSVLGACLSELRNSAVSEAKDQLAALEKRRQDELAKGQRHIDAAEYGQARTVFDELLSIIPDDPNLKGDIGERFLRAGRYEEAFHYLSQALEESPESIHFYNRIGIALRKLGRFETAERYYLKALEYAKDDPNLYFNVGRLYVDWKKWEDVAQMAHKALKYNPNFKEAGKMLAFANKQMAK